jgi:hypothetical protein
MCGYEQNTRNELERMAVLYSSLQWMALARFLQRRAFFHPDYLSLKKRVN